MFDIGFLELLVIGVVGLLVLGPERLPKAARTVGLWVGKVRRAVSNVQREINAQLEAEELRQKLSEQEKKLNAGLDKARREVESYAGTPDRKSEASASPADTMASNEDRIREDGHHEHAARTIGTTSADPAEHEPVAPSTSSATASDDKDSTPR